MNCNRIRHFFFLLKHFKEMLFFYQQCIFFICFWSKFNVFYFPIGLQQPDSMSGSGEHVCYEHALLRWTFHRCLQSLQHHLEVKSCSELCSRHFLLVFTFHLDFLSAIVNAAVQFDLVSFKNRLQADVILFPTGELICRGFTMEMSLAWRAKWSKIDLFPFLSVSEEQRRLAIHFLQVFSKILKTNIPILF